MHVFSHILEYSNRRTVTCIHNMYICIHMHIRLHASYTSESDIYSMPGENFGEFGEVNAIPLGAFFKGYKFLEWSKKGSSWK